ncbi:MAG: FCD domain-containing protein, partial [Sphaerochaetaceae bacterium]|nr:FCD domain-containing protein [Sphaerochaetaceae bacterium]
DAISEMKKIYFELVKDVRENNYQPDKDRMLHLKIAESTKNIHFIEIIKYFNHQMDNKIWQNFSEQIPNRTERMISNHWNIIKAIEDRDPDKARAMMEMHINIGLKTYFFNDNDL